MRDFSPQYILIPILLLRFQMNGSKDIPHEGIMGFVQECIFFLSRLTRSDLTSTIVPEIVAISHTVATYLCSMVIIHLHLIVVREIIHIFITIFFRCNVSMFTFLCFKRIMGKAVYLSELFFI